MWSPTSEPAFVPVLSVEDDAGDHLDPAKAVGLRTSGSTMITHGSGARADPLGPFILVVTSWSTRCRSDDERDGVQPRAIRVVVVPFRSTEINTLGYKYRGAV